MKTSAGFGIVARALLLFLVCSCSNALAAASREYTVRGIVRGLLPDEKTINIEHEEIPGYMAAMTMPFCLKSPKENPGLKVGDAVSFRLTVTENDSWIDQIRKIDASQVRIAPPKPEPATAPSNSSSRLRAGDPMPEFTLTDQAGQTITRETYKDRPFVLTFIFTRCPIPNFCPLMNRNLAELHEAIKGGSGPLAETQLLSISFDPEFDTPTVLKESAEHQKAAPNIWRFATGTPAQIKELTSRFSIHVQPESGTLSHGLATALVDAEGRIIEIWRGNGWKPQEVLGKVAELPARPVR